MSVCPDGLLPCCLFCSCLPATATDRFMWKMKGPRHSMNACYGTRTEGARPASHATSMLMVGGLRPASQGGGRHPGSKSTVDDMRAKCRRKDEKAGDNQRLGWRGCSVATMERRGLETGRVEACNAMI